MRDTATMKAFQNLNIQKKKKSNVMFNRDPIFFLKTGTGGRVI